MTLTSTKRLQPPKEAGLRVTKNWITLKGRYWTYYDYDIELRLIPTLMSLLNWVQHVSAKAWAYTTPNRVAYFIEAVCTAKGWDLWGAVDPCVCPAARRAAVSATRKALS
jgi:hypothetical protein